MSPFNELRIMNAHEQQLVGLINEKTEEIRESDILLTQSVSRLETAIELLPTSQIQPEKLYQFLEETEARVERLTRSLYSAMEAHTLVFRS
jgi:hypothetical protein